MKQIRKPIKVILHYLPCGYEYENKKDGFLSLVINHSKANKYSKTIKDRDMSVRQLAQYLEKCMEEMNDEEDK